jgi:uncharacterized protein
MPILVHVIEPDGRYSLIRLGSDIEKSEVFQVVVKAGSWFASELDQDCISREPKSYTRAESFALAGCTVAPGFDFADFELAMREDLIKCHPQHRSLITRLTRE